MTSVVIEDSEQALTIDNNFMNGELKKVYLGRNINYPEGFAPFSGLDYLESLTIGSKVTKIGKSAFAANKSLKTVESNAEIVPETHQYAFTQSYLPNATLRVPYKLYDQYRTTTPWNLFGNFNNFEGLYNLTYLVDGKEYKKYVIEQGATIPPEAEPKKEGYKFSGWSEIPKTMPSHDVTVIGTFKRQFDVGHVVNLVNFIMNSNATSENIAFYDMNGDGELNIGDIILVVKAILNSGGSVSSAMRRAPGGIDFAQGTAAQFELKVDVGSSIKDIRLVSSMKSSHQLMYQQKDENTYMVVVFSQSNLLMNPVNGHIVEVESDGGDVVMQNIIVATPTGMLYSLKDGGSTTVIYEFENSEKSAVIYDLKGNRLDGRDLKKGLYIINGKKVVVK